MKHGSSHTLVDTSNITIQIIELDQILCDIRTILELLSDNKKQCYNYAWYSNKF